jgi:K+-sensing histidine kinase KdpD
VEGRAELHFRVQNEGQAVSAEELEQLFQPFTSGKAFQYENVGLGMLTFFHSMFVIQRAPRRW